MVGGSELPSLPSSGATLAAALALVVAGEAVFGLPFVVARVFRPTVLDVFGITNLQLGAAFSVYGVVAMLESFGIERRRLIPAGAGFLGGACPPPPPPPPLAKVLGGIPLKSCVLYSVMVPPLLINVNLPIKNPTPLN